jgi:hypothetical protein
MIIKSELAPAEVEAQIRRLVRPRLRGLDWLTFWFTWDGRRPPEFTGWVSGGRFRLRRLFGAWRYPFPVLTGDITPTSGGTEIRITTRPSVPDLLWPAAMLALATYAAWGTGAIGFPLVAIAVVFPITLVGWIAGARRARTILEQYLLAAFALVALATQGCAATAPLSNSYSMLTHDVGLPRCAEVDTTGECALFEASVVTLLAQPTAFDGKKVRDTGFVELRFEGNALYLSRELFEAGLSDYAIWLDVEGLRLSDPGRVRRRYVVIEGQFDAGNGGHLGAFPGALKTITRLERLR